MRELNVRLALKSDEGNVKALFVSDVYHWTRWWKPIFKYEILRLFKKPIAAGVFFLLLVGLWHPTLSTLLATLFVVALFAIWIARISQLVRLMRYLMEDNFAIETYNSGKPGNAFFVAEIDDEIVGAVAVVDSNSVREAKLCRMAVGSQCRGVGIGKRLLETAIDFADKFGYEEIVAATNLSQAKRFYVQNGFEIYSQEFLFHRGVPTASTG